MSMLLQHCEGGFRHSSGNLPQTVTLLYFAWDVPGYLPPVSLSEVFVAFLGPHASAGMLIRLIRPQCLPNLA